MNVTCVTLSVVGCNVSMPWLVFSYSLPSKSKSGPRVTAWRRLGRTGAISPTSGVYLLPAREECLEVFQWLAQEIRQASGEALVMHVEQFEGLSDQDLMALFNTARGEAYREIEAQAATLEKSLHGKRQKESSAEYRDQFAKLERQYNEITRLDYFDSSERGRVAKRLEQLRQLLVPALPKKIGVASHTLDSYRDKRWVTRPHPHVDRLACIWLIRKFINPQAFIRYSLHPEPDEIAFDMPGAELGHHGSHCTFETMLNVFNLEEPMLQAMAEIVHEIDLRDGQYARASTEGVDLILKGWLLAGFSDADLEAHGIALFEGMYKALSGTTRASSRGKKKQEK